MDLQKCFLTKQGFAKVKREYNFLRRLKQSKVTTQAPQVIVSEEINSEYISFYQDLSLLEIRLAKLADIIKNAVIIRPPTHEERGIVGVGATVEVENQGQVDELKIVGSVEADPADGRISCTSPVGSALLGHRVGDKILVQSPLKTLYKILNVKYQMA